MPRSRSRPGANGSVDTNTLQQPVVGFVLTNVGLEAGISLQGAKDRVGQALTELKHHCCSLFAVRCSLWAPGYRRRTSSSTASEPDHT